PALGLVKVSVEEADYSQAREIIAQWESQEPKQEPAQASIGRLPSGYGAFAMFLLGLSVGAASVYWKLQSPVTRDGTDFDGDGHLEEVYTYKNGLFSKVE